MGKPCRRLIKFKPRFSLNVVHLTKGGGHWDFRFCGFGYLLGRFFRFLCRKTSVFRFGVHSGWRILRFKSLVFNIHKKNISGSSGLVSDVVFGFCYFGSGFSWICESILRLRKHLCAPLVTTLWH